MNFVKHLFQILNPTIKINHFKSTENIDGQEIQHDFLGFDVKDINISSRCQAKILAKKLGASLFPLLKKSAKNIKDPQQLKQYHQTMAWVNKKAVWHPALVEKCTHQLLDKMKKTNEFKKYFLTYEEIFTDVSIIAILHDIGRLSEIDIAQVSVKMKRSGLNKSHAEISYDILENAKIKPEILLAIRYHEFAGTKEASSDPLFTRLEKNRQELAKFYVCILQDMDKTANLVERSKFGIKKCAEFFDPNYVQDYDITPEFFKTAMSGSYLNNKGGHLLDAMIRFVTWTYSIHFNETKEILAAVLTDFFGQMYSEAEREYRNSTIKDSIKLAETLQKITQLEDYAIFQRLDMPICASMRQAINKKIQELKNV